MAVIDNQCTAPGDVLDIKFAIPILGLLALTDFVDDVDGETPTRFFYREFRYSLDGITYSSWIELTQANLQTISVTPNDYFFAEYKYTRQGSDLTGILSFNSIELKGLFQSFTCGPIFSQSIFAEFLSCPDVIALQWCVAVLKKIYERGIIPAYIERGVDPTTDRDYIDFWKAICCYFALFVSLGRTWGNFSDNPALLRDYLLQQGLYIRGTESSTTMNSLMRTLWEEYRLRGTMLVTYPSSVSGRDSDGEFLRLIDYRSSDEFIFDFVNNFAWYLDEFSPEYPSTENHVNCNKFYTKEQDFLSGYAYPYINSSYCSIASVAGKQVLSVQNIPIGEMAGLGSLSPTPSQFILVDDLVDYIISFGVMMSDNLSKYSFGVDCYDQNFVLLSSLDIETGMDSSWFFENQTLNQLGIFYYVNGIIFNRLEPLKLASEIKPDIGYGTWLQFQAGTKYIVPKIVLTNPTGASEVDFSLWDVRIKPLVIGQSLRTYYDNNGVLEYAPSTSNEPTRGCGSGFCLHPSPTAFIWRRNNNNSLTPEQINRICQEYLFPYNLTTQHIQL